MTLREQEDDEFIVCERCGTSNPPDRERCLHCGTVLES